MDINFDKILRDFDGAEIPMTAGGNDPTKLGYVCITALMASFPGEEQLPGTEKYKRYDLARKIHKGGTVNVPTEDVTLLKNLIGKAFAPLIVGSAYEILDPPPAR